MGNGSAPVRVLLCGYYGEHNLGDDALLQALLAQLPAGLHPVVTAFDEEAVRDQFGVETCSRRSFAAVLRALRRSSCLVFGGGSLLQDSTSVNSLIYYVVLIAIARCMGVSVLLWGQGLGPLRRRRSRALVRSVLPLTQGITWRDPTSAALASRWGVEAEVGSDPVWSFPPVAWSGPGGPIVLCWRRSQLLSPACWQVLLDALDALLTEEDRPVLWLPFHREQDRGLLTDLTRHFRIGAALRSRSHELDVSCAEAAMEVFAGAGLVIAMRLHGLILAALAGAPCEALSYDPKVEAAALGIGCGCVDLGGGFEAGPVVAGWRRSLDGPPDQGRIAALREGTAVHRRLLEHCRAAPLR